VFLRDKANKSPIFNKRGPETRYFRLDYGDSKKFRAAQSEGYAVLRWNDVYVIFRSAVNGTTNLGSMNWFQFN